LHAHEFSAEHVVARVSDTETAVDAEISFFLHGTSGYYDLTTVVGLYQLKSQLTTDHCSGPRQSCERHTVVVRVQKPV
jgi:hypothetical protein